MRPIPQDYHLHSEFSPDSRAPLEAMCRAAHERGLPEIGFTEHYDLHPADATRDFFRPEAWWRELRRCRELFAGELIIRAGVEIGEPHLFQAETQALLAAHPFDYALGSLHHLNGLSVFVPQFFDQPMDAAYRSYFLELEQMTRLGDFDILAHFDVPVRLGAQLHGGYDPRRYEDVIRPVLRNCIARGLALDVNTSALRGRAQLLTPGTVVLRWYAEMGGERVTLGSDAHNPSQVGLHLDAALAAIREAGLRCLTFYERRQPRLIPLPA